MHDLELRTAEPTVLRHRRRRSLPWLIATATLLVLAGGGVAWWLHRPPAPVSVNQVIDKFRKSSPGAGRTSSGPPTGVYVYATTGGERISAGVKHHYPARTTLTVTTNDCGLDVRWDALAGRWADWQICHDGLGWRLVHYTDVHKFLYLQDVKDYSCTGYPVVSCRTRDGLLTSTVQAVGRESLTLDGATVRVTHLRINQEATGKSVSSGTVDVWVLPSGLPARLTIRDHGYSVVLGSHIDYFESATFRLTSASPRR
ncbi:MAG TPA: hypothetical protein VFH66_12070 [Mycobacteriales bacterium]|nr:hypothetical protein [Mycobacteriales bacterium]